MARMGDDSKDLIAAQIRKDLLEHGTTEGFEAALKLKETSEDVVAEALDPAGRIRSAEGVVTFAGLGPEIRGWLDKRLDDLGGINGNGGANGNGAPNGGADAAEAPNGGESGSHADEPPP